MTTTQPVSNATAVEVEESDHANRRAWMVLLLAGGFEILFALSTNGSQGFTHLGWSLATVASAAATIFTLSVALKTIDVGVGYAVWTGIGATGAAVFGSIVFDEQLSPLRILFLAVIIGGIVWLKLASGPQEQTDG